MHDPITRRQLLRRAAAGGAVLSLPSLLAACGGDSGIEGERQHRVHGRAGRHDARGDAHDLELAALHRHHEKTKKRPTLEQFEQETGVPVKYIEDVNDNEEWFGKFQAQLAQGQAIDRDITVLTDWMAARMVRLGYVEKLNKERDPEQLQPRGRAAEPGWDPQREYSMPWQSGLTGIAYNEKKLGKAITSIDQLLHGPRPQGRGHCLSEMPDTMGLVMSSNGDDPSKVTDDAFDEGDRQAPGGGRLRADPTVHRATTSAAAWRRATSSPRLRGRETSCSSSSTTRT